MKQQIIIFDSPDGDIKLDVRFNPKEETVCISLKQLSELFQRDKSVISRHLKSIFENNELEKSSVVAKYATTSADCVPQTISACPSPFRSAITGEPVIEPL